LPVGLFWPALGSVAFGLSAGEIYLGGSIFSGRRAPYEDAMRMASGPETGRCVRSFGAQLDPSASSLCCRGLEQYYVCRGLEQYYVIVSVSTRFLEGKTPPASDSVPGGEGEFSHDALARAIRQVPGNRALPDLRPPCAPVGLPRLSGHELTS
jgi:hypothetical protein